ncbi:MAG: FAD-binding oxidoreductase [Candidatus Krumholzibacteria bacterium]|nr:FAD-binding oxidoreductase [Candidatus Krumholzibacteria bacterium]MDH4337094.1 FAD-binding oxidoreductase [Candidatus Krumholzibacteria bacterium]MDH5268631.1 FAD-binding oxidoreductase [Candidatus Krumholzibacteria bacterium]
MSNLAATSREGKPIEVDVKHVDALRAALRGSLHLAGSPGYDTSRTLWNGMIDRHPALVVRALGVADVVTVVNFARQHGIALSMKGGGHNIAGLACCDGGLLLDMGAMRGVWVDPAGRIAHAQGGCLLGDVDRETQLHGLAAPLGFVSLTGIAGLTLGGGFGYMSRQCGWTSDSVRSMTLVTAEGKIVRASEKENKDLFWGLRGGGGNFGVVTNIEYSLYPVGPEIVGGAVAWRGESAVEVMELFRKSAAAAPEDLTLVLILRLAPPAPWIDKDVHGKPVAIIIGCHTGKVADGEKLLAPIKGFGKPVGDVMQRRPYVTQQSLLDATQPNGRRYYWKSEYVSGFEPEVFAKLKEHGDKIVSPHSAAILFQLGGAIGRLPNSHSAVGNRGTGGLFNITAAWDNAADDAKNIDWARNAWKDLKQFSTGGTYVNFLNADEAGDRIQDAFGGNMKRLGEVKQAWDPDNLFRVNKNIAPAK